MFRKGKIALAAFVAAAMMVPLAACGGGNEADADGKVTITYFSWNNEKQMKPIVKAFEKANPDIKVDMSTAQGSANDYIQTLTTRIAGDQTPDVFHMSTENRNEIMDAGVARDITNEPFMKHIDDSYKKLFTRDGKVYGYSPTAWAGGIIYNKDLLKQVGYDTVPKTLEEFNQLGKKLQAAGITPYMEDLSVASTSFQPMLGGYYAGQGIKTNDDDIYNNKKTMSDVWTPVLKQWKTMVDSGTLPKETVGVSSDQIKQQFLTGKLAMYRSGPWDAPDLNESGINYGFAAFPAVEGGEQMVGGGPDSPYAISAKTEGKKLKAAEKFLAFIDSAEGEKLLEKNLGAISISSTYKANVDEHFADVYNDYIAKGKMYWVDWPSAGTVMTQEMTSQWQLMVQGQASPADVTKALDAKWQANAK